MAFTMESPVSSLSLAMAINIRARKACSKESAKASVECSSSPQQVSDSPSSLKRIVPENRQG